MDGPCKPHDPRRDLSCVSKDPSRNRAGRAWRWAITNLLPNASTTTVFNLYHFSSQRPNYKTDPQSNATVGNLDYAIQKRAFVIDLVSREHSWGLGHG